MSFLKRCPGAHLISLGIGDTTEPLPSSIAEALSEAARQLGTRSGYTGYGPEKGMSQLREKIAHVMYSDRVKAEDIFISDGAKCDIGRLQILFGNTVRVAIQDPAYPVYVDGSLLQGVNHMHFMPCNPENHFFPELVRVPEVDVIYFCSPNNPTGAAATHQQLKQLVRFAKQNRALIIFDSAYAAYIQDPALPRSIYEIEGAEEVAIEISSFSKIAGFTGVRLGWTIVPEALKYEDGRSVKNDWARVNSTIFNGASNIVQSGGCAILEEAGYSQVRELMAFYMENTRLLKTAFEGRKFEVYGGDHVPYLWLRFDRRNSWDVFDEFLEKYHLVVTPGSGFGLSGEGFIRVSAFGHREHILEAVARLDSRR